MHFGDVIGGFSAIVCGALGKLVSLSVSISVPRASATSEDNFLLSMVAGTPLTRWVQTGGRAEQLMADHSMVEASTGKPATERDRPSKLKLPKVAWVRLKRCQGSLMAKRPILLRSFRSLRILLWSSCAQRAGREYL